MERLPPLEVGDLLFVSGNEWSSTIIKFFLKSEYSHVTVATGPATICEVDLFEKMKIMPNPYLEFDLYRVKGGLTAKQKTQLVNFLNEKCKNNLGYDWWRLLSIAIKRYFNKEIIVHELNRYICSEIIDKAFQHIGIDLVSHRETGDVTPIELLHSNRLYRVEHRLKLSQ